MSPSTGHEAREKVATSAAARVLLTFQTGEPDVGLNVLHGFDRITGCTRVRLRIDREANACGSFNCWTSTCLFATHSFVDAPLKDILLLDELYAQRSYRLHTGGDSDGSIHHFRPLSVTSLTLPHYATLR
ncbi:hypothetical protein AB1N83_003759 [Pleurotus pulmonarius]